MMNSSSHPIEKFWSQAYASYQKEPGVFVVADMVDPILSPRFGKRNGPHLNLIQNINHDVTTIPDYTLRNNFFLCVLKTKEAKLASEKYLVKDLKDAKEDEVFWELLKNGFAKDYQFLHTLMDFLPNLKAQFKVGYLLDDENEGLPIGCVVIGHTDHEAILLSGMIKDTHRDQKRSRDLTSLVNIIAQKENIEEYFYWTMSERLTRYADQIDRYLIYTKNKQ
ncbi:MAG: hypothetical protein GY909_01635 [Oligoflexia bacterium]|nr:hypothetical protein [Oligoflexia bacterium]